MIAFPEDKAKQLVSCQDAIEATFTACRHAGYDYRGPITGTPGKAPFSAAVLRSELKRITAKIPPAIYKQCKSLCDDAALVAVTNCEVAK